MRDGMMRSTMVRGGVVRQRGVVGSRVVGGGAVRLNFYQIVAMVGKAAFVYVRVRFLNDGFGSSLEPAHALSVDCMGLASFGSKMIMSVALPAVFLFYVFLVWAVSKAIARMSNGAVSELQQDRLFNVGMSVMFTFFGAIASVSMTLFKCSPNPNEKLTLADDHSIICYEDAEWMSLVVVAALAVLLYVIGFGSLVTWVILTAPRKFAGNASFQMRWKFLFIKFSPDVYWWSLIFVGKNFLMNLGFVVFNTGLAQSYWVMTIGLLYLTLVIMYMPYRRGATAVWR